jgi:hypothetical protein
MKETHHSSTIGQSPNTMGKNELPFVRQVDPRAHTTTHTRTRWYKQAKNHPHNTHRRKMTASLHCIALPKLETEGNDTPHTLTHRVQAMAAVDKARITPNQAETMIKTHPIQPEKQTDEGSPRM